MIPLREKDEHDSCQHGNVVQTCIQLQPATLPMPLCPVHNRITDWKGLLVMQPAQQLLPCFAELSRLRIMDFKRLQTTLGHMFNTTEEAISSPVPSPQATSPRPFSPQARGRLLQPQGLSYHPSSGLHAAHLRCLLARVQANTCCKP